MYLGFEKILENTEFQFKYFWGSIYFFITALCIIIFVKKTLKRWYYYRVYPSRRVNFYNVFGNAPDFVPNRAMKNQHYSIYVLQVLMGYRQIFKNESFFFFGLSYSPYIILTKAKAVEEVISGSKNMEKNWMYSFLHPWLGTGLLTSHGSKWKSRRKLLTPSFHFEILKDFLPVFNEQSQILVDLLKNETTRQWTDIITPITLCSLDIVCETTLGVSIGAQKDSESEYVKAVSRASDMFMKRLVYPPYFADWYFFLSSTGQQFRKDLKMLHNFTRKVIADKKHALLNDINAKEIGGKKRKALLDLLLEQHIQNGSLTEEDIREEVDTFAFEGHDTTSMGMSWALYLIGLYQSVQDKLHEEIDRVFGEDLERPVTTDDLKDVEYLDRVLKEAQRLYPSVPFFGRNLSEDTTVCGTKVPKEVSAMVLVYALHRDESVFPDPEKFDPDRFLPENAAKRSAFAYIPFSAGPRNCIDVLQVIMGYRELFKNEGFFFFGLAYSPLIVLTKAKAVEDVISGTKNMEKNWIYNFLHPWLGTGLLTSHGSKWKSRRKLLTPAFHFEILKDFLPVFNEQSQILVDLLKKETTRPWTDIITPITLCSLDIVCETTLGVCIGAQKDSESEYVKLVSRASEMFMKRLVYPPYFVDWYFFLSPTGQQFKKDLKMLHNFTRKVIADKKHTLLNDTNAKESSGKKRKALLDLLLEQHIQNGSLTEEDIREEVDTFAFEGHDTTSMGMNWALYLIGLYQSVQDKLHEEIDRVFGDDLERPVTTDDLKDMEYLDRVLKEAQRLYPSVPVFSRNLSEDTTVCGTKVTKEVSAMIFAYALHRDESVFPNPEKFDPDRFLPENAAKRSAYAYIPFSAGPRNCIGQRFAIMEVKVVIIHVLRHYTIESLDARDKVLVTPELILRAANPIRLKLRSRRPLLI